MMTNNQQSSSLIIIAAIFAMSMLVLVSVAEVLDLFPDVEAREGKYSNGDKKYYDDDKKYYGYDKKDPHYGYDDKYGPPQIESVALQYFPEHWGR